MRTQFLLAVGSVLLLTGGYVAGAHKAAQAQTYPERRATVPKSYGKLSAVIADSIGTGLVFEDAEGVIRFVSVTGMKEGELDRYDQNAIHGGIPKSYGRLAGAVVNHGQTGLVFEDAQGVIRFVSLTGITEAELARN